MKKLITAIATSVALLTTTAAVAHTDYSEQEIKVHHFKYSSDYGWSEFVLDTSHLADDTKIHCVLFDAEKTPVGTVQGHTDPIATSGTFYGKASSVVCLVV